MMGGVAEDGNVEDIDDLWLLFFSEYKYIELVRPLLLIHRERGLTYGQLTVKYGVSTRQLNYYLKSKKQEDEKDENQ